MTELLLKLDEREDLSPEEEQLAEMLTILIEECEAKHYPLPPVAPREALKELMEERGLRHSDIWPVLGNKGAEHRKFSMASDPSAKRRQRSWLSSSAFLSNCSSRYPGGSIQCGRSLDGKNPREQYGESNRQTGSRV